MSTELLAQLLPEPTLLRLDSWSLDAERSHLTLCICSIQSTSPCPGCTAPGARIHSRYGRTLADLPWATWHLTLKLTVRKFFCSHSTCKRRIFTERLASVVEPWARRTRRLVERLNQVGLALGGAAAARLTRHLGCVASRNTLLRSVAKLPLPSIVAAPRTLGVDDFAMRKRQNYGTILIDLEQSRPIALLADREAKSLSEWLQAHPGAQVISRDRACAYKSGAIQGAPQAIQVADRFHLLHNLAEVLTEVFASRTAAVRAIDAAARPSAMEDLQEEQAEEVKRAEEQAVASTTVKPQASVMEVSPADRRHQQRLGLHEQIWKLHRRGWSAPAIARRVGASPKTVQRYLRTPAPPERQFRSDRGHSRNGLDTGSE